ncbi:MAG: hypothetical protein ACYS26_05435 [Planctomycetota bacterium]|jgi:hypothetical protein
MIKLKDILLEVSKVFYHGTPDSRQISKQAGFERKTKTINYIEDLDRYKELQRQLKDTDYANIGQIGKEIKSLEKKHTFRSPIFLTDTLSVAKTYSKKPAWDSQSSIPKVYKVKTSPSKILTLDIKGKRFDFLDAGLVASAFKSAGEDTNTFHNLLQKYEYYQLDNIKGVPTDSLVAIADELGFDCIDVLNAEDSYNVGNKVSTVRIMLEPNDISIIR